MQDCEQNVKISHCTSWRLGYATINVNDLGLELC